MLQINIIRGFLNRLRDRGWKNINLRGYTNNDIQILKRGDKSIVVIESITIDPSVDINPQAEEFFRNLIELIEHGTAKEIFLPGGGDISIPAFFKDWCDKNDVKINILTLNNFQDFYNYN
jgi:hypothetical protein